MSHPTIRYNEQRRELILAHCHFVALPPELVDAFGEGTEYLDCSHNRLMNLSYLYDFTNLKYLILDSNRLHEAHFSQLQWSLPNVELLMLNRNELMDLQRTITLLATIFPNLEYLSLHGNPICPDQLELQPFCEYVHYDYEYYRSQISSAFTKLKFLDHYDLQRSYRKVVSQPAAANEKVLLWLKNNLQNSSVQPRKPKPHKQKYGSFNFGKLSKLRTLGLIQLEGSAEDCGIADQQL